QARACLALLAKRDEDDPAWSRCDAALGQWLTAHAELYPTRVVGHAAENRGRRMNLMLAFLFGCIVLGLWLPPRRQVRWLVGIIAVLLVAFFLFSPSHL